MASECNDGTAAPFETLRKIRLTISHELSYWIAIQRFSCRNNSRATPASVLWGLMEDSYRRAKSLSHILFRPSTRTFKDVSINSIFKPVNSRSGLVIGMYFYLSIIRELYNAVQHGQIVVVEVGTGEICSSICAQLSNGPNRACGVVKKENIS